MTDTAIYWPLMAQVALTLVAYAVMSKRRVAAVRAEAAKARDFKVPNDPELSATAARNVSNQFELPVLFYVVCLAMYQTNGVDYLTVVLAWLFVVSRIAHAWGHMTSNSLRLRRPLFIAGFVLVFVMWVVFAIRIAGFGG
ncbi:MAG: MAPEG family protein [Oricola sp.]